MLRKGATPVALIRETANPSLDAGLYARLVQTFLADSATVGDEPPTFARAALDDVAMGLRVTRYASRLETDLGPFLSLLERIAELGLDLDERTRKHGETK